MDVVTFRWVLILIGVLILGGMLLYGNPNRRKRPRASRKRKNVRSSRLEPTLGGDAGPPHQAGSPGEGEAGESLQAELDMGDADGGEESTVAKPARPAPPPPDMIVTLYLLARGNHRITGVDLLDGAIKSGLVFGDHDIFHRVVEGDERPVFSMANLTNPGYFDKQAWNTLETIGVTLFMTLPGPCRGLDAWDAMLATSHRLAELLQADLLDDERAPFTRQRGARIRDAMREYDRSHFGI